VFDLGLSKLAVIGVVALVVIGPERLPRVARTFGTLLGRAQRYLADVKAEVNREMQLDELKSMRDTVRDAASSFESAVHDNLRQTSSELESAFDTSSTPTPSLMMPLSASPPTPTPPAKRNKWRRNVTQRTSATPLWYKSASRKRTRVQSGAARVARYRIR
jgi:sec-independent protein translocase protein TatB